MVNETAFAGQKLSSPHHALIAGILEANPTAKTRGFKDALRKLPDTSTLQSEITSDWFRHLGIIPDAYMVDLGRKVVTIFEAVVCNEIENDKFKRIADLAWMLDEDEYVLRLIRVDQFSATTYDPLAAQLLQQARGDDRWQDLTLEMTHAHPLVHQINAVMQFTTLAPLTEGAAA
ncbi:hypothetical protein ASE67_02755 [Sphingomonas sp. Leaf23]|uniref:hypothetical protein n=1 Tax=Sphingomonas sp. Leaf23 TaxID=1735689 RepID=UPI0006FC0400|nr:hypothetical protein [Sphingomonas sp. Leaf23]KQM88680.1 hypothetical protein ASE67_02755 [Sphingomonas sp. Leaf23]